MANNIYDLGIIGCGVAGTFVTYKLHKDYKNVKTIVIDSGRPPAKRRSQMQGFLGLLPNSDGKFFLNDLNKVSDLSGLRKSKSAFNQFQKIISNVNTFKIIKDRSPNISIEKKLNKIGYEVTTNDYIQLYPKDIHTLSKYISELTENSKNITFSFDNEVKSICKQKNTFIITTEDQEYKCKKIIIAVGRSGWRWANNLYHSFGIVDNNDYAKFGIHIELNAQLMKDFNKSNCTLTKANEIEIGPFSWLGTIIPEDHSDLVISSFRANENRWKSDKVSFSLIGNRFFPKKGSEQTDRIGKLTFILANDRIIKEKVSNIVNNKSKISIIPEYNWLKQYILELSTVIPEILTKAYFYIPCVSPTISNINIGNNLESEIDGMYVIGESANINGLLGAATTGLISIDSIFK